MGAGLIRCRNTRIAMIEIPTWFAVAVLILLLVNAVGWICVLWSK